MRVIIPTGILGALPEQRGQPTLCACKEEHPNPELVLSLEAVMGLRTKNTHVHANTLVDKNSQHYSAGTETLVFQHSCIHGSHLDEIQCQGHHGMKD